MVYLKDSRNLWGLGMVISGTFSTLIMKLEYSTLSTGREICFVPGTNETTYNCLFDKPWFGVLQMKIAMSLCLVYLYIRKKITHHKYLETPLIDLKYGNNRKTLPRKLKSHSKKKQGETDPILSKEEKPRPTWKTLCMLAVPSSLDLFQTVLGNIGLVWVSSSIFQMARGSVIAFSAVLSVKYLGKKIYAHHIASIVIVCIAIIFVGLAGLYQHQSSATATVSKELLGLVFIILGQVLCAVQIVIEEHMMTSLHVTPVLLVGFEGLWGLVMLLFLAPVLTITPMQNTAISKVWHEDFIDSFIKLFSSSTLIFSFFAYILVVGALNVTANYVTKHFSAVVRSILEACRTLGVWIAGLVLYYVFQLQGPTSPGESWNIWSWLELLGFLALLYGTFTYKKILKLPCKRLYHAEEQDLYKSPFMAQMHQ